jgi:hypothetical protein
MKNTVTIKVGNNRLVDASQRAFTISKSKKTGPYDSVQWETSEMGTFRVEFTNGTPFSVVYGDVVSGTPWTPQVDTVHVVLHHAYKYKVYIPGNADKPIDDPYVVIEE